MKHFILIVSVVLLLSPGFAYADLTPKDNATLTNDLEALSISRIQSVVDSATGVLCKVNRAGKPVYNATDWESWFNNFFNTTNHPYTDSLADYLTYPVFLWCNDATHLNLQMGLANALWNKISNITSAHSADLGSAMYNDVLLRQSLLNAHSFFALLTESGVVDRTTRTNVYINYKNYIKSYLQYFSDTTTIDNVLQPFVALLRAQVWVSFGQALPLNTTSKGDIATMISLGSVVPRKLDIWNTFTVLVIDNNGLDLAQLNIIYNLLNDIPGELHNLRYVTVRDFFFLPSSWRVILNKGDTINYNLAIKPDNTVQFAFHNTTGAAEEFSTQTPLAPDAWNHVAATFDGSTVAMYINGVKDTTHVATGLPNAGSLHALELGRRISQHQWLRGKLDEVKIYNRALSATEIGDEYNHRPISTNGLVAYNKMNEPGVMFVADSPGFGNNGIDGAPIIPARVYKGLFFDGENDHVEVPDNPNLRLPKAMTVEAWVYFANEAGKWTFSKNSGIVNVMGLKVGASSANPFPSDISAVYDDEFSTVAAHEFNHVVDTFYVFGNATRKARREQLITQAGTLALQYLRSMFVNSEGNSIFPHVYEEFFASIVNQYFTDSWHTFDLAIQRFDKGYKEPINQFLLLADVYSKGGLTTKFYTFNKKGILTVNEVPIYRDLFGHITEITRHSTNTIYRFILDFNGNVLFYRTSPTTTH